MGQFLLGELAFAIHVIETAKDLAGLRTARENRFTIVTCRKGSRTRSDTCGLRSCASSTIRSCDRGLRVMR